MISAWVVIPTYNEAENLGSLVEAVLGAMSTAGRDVSCSVLVVDDNSPDGTGLIAGRLAREHAAVHVLHRTGERGLGRAYVAGFKVALDAGADYVLEMDADFSHDPADLPRLLRAVLGDADVALGSRYVAGGAVEGWPLRRRLLSRAGSRYARAVLGGHVHDLTGGFKCYRAHALRVLDLDSIRSNGYAFQIETTYRAIRSRLDVVEVPIVFRERRHGRSKMSIAIAVEALWRIPAIRRETTGERRITPAQALS